MPNKFHARAQARTRELLVQVAPLLAEATTLLASAVEWAQFAGNMPKKATSEWTTVDLAKDAASVALRSLRASARTCGVDPQALFAAQQAGHKRGDDAIQAWEEPAEAPPTKLVRARRTRSKGRAR